MKVMPNQCNWGLSRLILNLNLNENEKVKTKDRTPTHWADLTEELDWSSIWEPNLDI